MSFEVTLSYCHIVLHVINFCIGSDFDGNCLYCKLIRDPVHERFFRRNSNSMENWYYCNFVIEYHSTTKFSHAKTAQLSYDVQHVIVITLIQFGSKQNEFSVEFELRYKNRSSNEVLVYFMQQFCILVDNGLYSLTGATFTNKPREISKLHGIGLQLIDYIEIWQAALIPKRPLNFKITGWL